MKNVLTYAALGVALSGFSLSAAAAAVLEAQLEQKLGQMSPTEQTMVIVSYEQLEPLNTTQLQQLLALGVNHGVQYQTLPVIGALAAPSQIRQIAQLPGVRSIYLNKPLEYFNANSRDLTGAQNLQSDAFMARNGRKFTGKGVTIIVNDSGIDATHQDLMFGANKKVIENVQGLTHSDIISAFTPIEGMWIKGQQNTDLNVGHGTHCAGTIAGWGTRSNGKYQGVAPDAKLIGYGSGAGISILDALGGYDFAIANVWSYQSPIKVMSNSWGSSGKFDPYGPITLASYKATKLGIISVFAAGNSGSGEDTHNPYAQIPWGISVGAGDKNGKLAAFSSRGKRGESGEFDMPDGSHWTYNNEITVVAPGVDVISTRALTNLASNGGANDVGAIEDAYLPFYTMISGTSMATPHVAGIVALMLEANPNLSPADIKRALQETATNMPGYEKWEVGTGYVNAHAAVSAVAEGRDNYKQTVNNLNQFNANAILNSGGPAIPFEVFFTPVGAVSETSFEVDSDVAWVMASATSFANLVKLKLTAPDGTVYFGNLTLPLLETDMRVSAPGQQGTWKISAYGLTSLSGVRPDQFGLTNGPGLPEYIAGEVTFLRSGGFSGLDDVPGHAARGAIEYAISERLMDGYSDGKFRPNNALKRKELAQYLVMGSAVRQYRPFLNEPTNSWSSVPASSKPFADAVSAKGGALKDRGQVQQAVMKDVNGSFAPEGKVSRLDLVYSLVQGMGMEAEALAFDTSKDVTIDYNGQKIKLEDQNLIPINMKGYVQVALDLSLIHSRWSVQQGPYDLFPKLVAYLDPSKDITRAEYAVIAGRLMDNYYKE